MTVSRVSADNKGIVAPPTVAPDQAAFAQRLTVAQMDARSICKALLSDFEKQVNGLHSLIRPLQDAGFRRDDAEARKLWQRAVKLLTDMNRTVAALKECAVGVGRDGQPLLTDAERALLGRLMDRARKAAEAGDLPIPNELYFKAKSGDPDAIRRLEDFLRAAGRGAQRGAEISVNIILGILGILGAAAGALRRPAY